MKWILLALLVVASGGDCFADSPPAGYPSSITLSLTGTGPLAGSHVLTWMNEDDFIGSPGYEWTLPGGDNTHLMLLNDSLLSDPGAAAGHWYLSGADGTYNGGQGLGLSADSLSFNGVTPPSAFQMQVTDYQSGLGLQGSDSPYGESGVVTVPEFSGAAAALFPAMGLLRRPRRQGR